jgi:uncharacterized membrane protein YkoI
MRQPELLVMLWVAMLSLFAVPVFGAEDRDYDRARDLYEQGDIRSLADVLRRARESTDGEVVNVDLVQRDGRWIYRLDIVAPDGHRKTVEISATPGSGDDKGQGSPGQ